MRILIICCLIVACMAGPCTAACPPLSLLDRELPVATEGVPYDAAIPVLGGAAPVRLLLTEGLLPPGLSFSASGQLNGTPRGAGEYRFRVVASDACVPQQQATRQYRVAVGKPGETLNLTSSRNLPPLKLQVSPLTTELTAPASAPVVMLRYRLAATPAESAVFESPGQSFLVDGSVAASVAAPLDAVLINGAAEIEERVTIPLAAVRSAKNGSGSVVINRPFTGRGTSAAALFTVRITP